jgi:hypothetical protein
MSDAQTAGVVYNNEPLMVVTLGIHKILQGDEDLRSWHVWDHACHYHVHGPECPVDECGGSV